MADKKFFKPVVIERWVVVIYEQKLRFGEENAKDMMSTSQNSFHLGVIMNLTSCRGTW
jgi:hypothetical protein